MTAWTEYPMLYRLIKEMAADNGMQMHKTPTWPANASSLEKDARRLNVSGLDFPEDAVEEYENELVILAAGEASDIDKLVKRKSLEAVHKFLAEVFDGELTYDFFTRSYRVGEES